jgi:hypothetical protein
MEYVESVEDIIDDVYKVGEKRVNCISGWQFVESAVGADEGVLEFASDRTCAVTVFVEAVQKAPKTIRWLLNSYWHPRYGGEIVVLQQKLKLRVPEQRYGLGSHDSQEIVYRSYVLQGVGTAGHSVQVLRSSMKVI